jgi:hypothetical protein
LKHKRSNRSSQTQAQTLELVLILRDQARIIRTMAEAITVIQMAIMAMAMTVTMATMEMAITETGITVTGITAIMVAQAMVSRMVVELRQAKEPQILGATARLMVE